MAIKLVAPPGTSGTVLGLAKKLAQKTGMKNPAIFEGYTIIGFPEKQMGLVLLPDLYPFLSHYFTPTTAYQTVDYNQPWYTRVGEPTRHEVSDTVLPEGLNDTHRLFGSEALGEPHLKNTGYNTFLSGLNSPAWKTYFLQLYQYLLDVDSNYRDSQEYLDWYAEHSDHLVDGHDEIHGDFEPAVRTNYDIATNERRVADSIRSYMAAFDVYTYITTYFPEDSVCDALFDWVGSKYKVFPTYNGSAIYTGPAQYVANGNPLWLNLYPTMCRRTNEGEYIMIFPMDIMDQLNKTPIYEDNVTAADLYLTATEYDKFIDEPGIDWDDDYEKQNVMQWYWVAYRATDVFNTAHLAEQTFRLAYDLDRNLEDNAQGQESAVSFSFDSTIPGQDFNIRSTLSSAGRLGLVQDDQILLNAETLLSYGETQSYHIYGTTGGVYTPQNSEGAYFPYDRVAQHVDYLANSVFIQIKTANVVSTPITGGYNISGDIVFTEVINPVGMRQDAIDEYFAAQDYENYDLDASLLHYWEPYKFYDLGQYIGVGSKLDGMVSPWKNEVERADKVIFNKTVHETNYSETTYLEGDPAIPFTNYVSLQENWDVKWRHLQMLHQSTNRELSFHTSIVKVVEYQEALVTYNAWQVGLFICNPSIPPDGQQSSLVDYCYETVTTVTTDKTVHGYFFKTFDIVGDQLVVTDGETVDITVSLGSCSGEEKIITQPIGWGTFPGSRAATQGNLSVSAIDYDIHYQPFPGAPKEVGAHIHIPAISCNPVLNLELESSDWLHSTAHPWPFSLDAITITPGVFTETNLQADTEQGYAPIFVDIAGHKLQTKDGDFYLDGEYLFSPTETLVTDGIDYNGQEVDPWTYQYRNIARMEGVPQEYVVGDGFTGLSLGEQNNLYCWGDTDTQVVINTVTHYIRYRIQALPPFRFAQEYQYTADSDGFNITDKVPKQVLMYMGNTIYKGQQLVAGRYFKNLQGGTYFPEADAVNVSNTYTDIICPDPLYSSAFYWDYYTNARTVPLTTEEQITTIGLVTNYGWQSFQNKFQIGYEMTNTEGMSSIAIANFRAWIYWINLYVSAWFDDNQNLQLCFFQEATQAIWYNNSKTGQWIDASFQYNDFLTPNSIPIRWSYNESDPENNNDRIQPEDLITHEAFIDAALEQPYVGSSRQDWYPNPTLHENLSSFIVNNTGEIA